MNNTSVQSLSLAAFLAICVFTSGSYAVPVAFPGAEGHGAYSVGGRGGNVYHVTNLNDSGAGSLRYGITSAGGTAATARTIVFDVSGTIALTSTLSINKSYITIAGQTAPGDGICLRDHSLTVAANHIIVRYIRVRLGDESLTEDDGIWINGPGHDIIMDHVTSSWSVDEVFSCSTSSAGLTNVTVQWCMITEALNNSIHGKGLHGYGALIRGCYDGKYTYHHNLWAHNAGRNPRPGNYDSNPYTSDPCGLLFDFRNNVIYNWNGSRPGAEYDTLSVCRYNYVGNYVKPGPNSSAGALFLTQDHHFMGYFSGNYFGGTYSSNDWNWVTFSTANGAWTPAELATYKQTVPFATGTIATDTATAAYTRVMSHAGASLPLRDSVDTRVVNEVSTGTGMIIDTQGQVGGWPTLNSLPAPLDTDQDGMPDAWETANGLSPTNAADRNSYTFSSDYTNLEVYLNSLVPDGTYNADLIPPTPNPMTWASAPAAAGDTSITMTASTATDASGVEYLFTCTSGAGHSSAWQDGTLYTDTGLTPGTYAYTVTARDKSLTQNTTGASSAGYVTLNAPPDTTAPTPSPMTWSVAPYGAGYHSISMTATTANDVSGVEYLFTCTSGGGNSPAWQDSTTYVDTGLAEGATCSYNVRARDKSPAQNTTSPSTPDASASTTLDTTAPTPNPMTWASVPAVTGLYTITMTASTASDISDVEYYFANTTDASHDSGWRDNAEWTDTGLVNNTTYTYRVIARDKSLARNETAWSDPNWATTLRYQCTGPIASDLSTDCQVDFLDYALMANQWGQELPLNVETLTNGTFEADVLPWQIFALPGATGYFVASFDNLTGNPVGSAIVGSDTDPDGTTGYWFYQTIPVIAGKQYKLSGEWMGDLSGSVATDPCNLGNWAEVKVAFESNTDPNTWTSLAEPNAVMYRKAFGSTTVNIGPSGVWDWEQMTASPTNGPTDGVFTATGGYMVVAFNEGGLPLSGVGYYYLDNLAVRTSPCPSVDFNGDCFLDMKDIAAFAEQWLACNRNPASECWK